MGRRTVLLLVAALIAALGTSMVFLYVRGADDRAQAAQDPVQVLKAVSVITAGETLQQAQSAGKIQLGPVPRSQVLSGALDSTTTIADKVALVSIYPDEQIISAKFGAPGDVTALAVPRGKIAISVNLTDTGRVAGFVAPGAEVAVFLSATSQPGLAESVRLVLPRVQVIAVGATTTISTTTTTATGAETTEEVPKTLATLAVTQAEAERIMFAAAHGELQFAMLSDTSAVRPGPGTDASNLFE